jgi:hypothetical protein
VLARKLFGTGNGFVYQGNGGPSNPGSTNPSSTNPS